MGTDSLYIYIYIYSIRFRQPAAVIWPQAFPHMYVYLFICIQIKSLWSTYAQVINISESTTITSCFASDAHLNTLPPILPRLDNRKQHGMPENFQTISTFIQFLNTFVVALSAKVCHVGTFLGNWSQMDTDIRARPFSKDEGGIKWGRMNAKYQI